MRTRVFLGPSLSGAHARQRLPYAEFWPPAALGDIHRAVLDGVHRVLIIDGYFEHVPAIWHKEILFTMSEGVEVLGAASMGALRTAELHAYGMVGVGEIFARYRDGLLEDDDEVAVAHADEDNDFRPVSEPMINVRWGLEIAVAEGIIGAASANRLAALAKSVFYAERTWPRVLRAATAEIPGGELSKLAEFLRSFEPNLKRDDALLALEIAGQPLPSSGSVPGFERTNAWACFEAAAAGC
ncbi:TfuA-like protein [Streptomyces sp. NBC_01221]|uniref:TfuA-like protein n=1 Tax=Streptomyces sp. NBC_01221 TaxID=2903782 RepID=UPI002254BFF0|nr:TfuA-like protein [Streptomyces sp. NBC_01221]MCX4791879.1 TfuA-like protein [Streptomyces sp. NBC_01221]